jgi:protein involved in polysaccharide export with SLBB domain
MEPGKGGSRLLAVAALTVGLALAAGCAANRPALDRALQADTGAPARNQGVCDCYLVACPDVLAVRVERRPALSGNQTVGVDGRIEFGSLGPLRVEGRSLPDCTRLLAEAAGVPAAQVQVQVAEFRSQQIYLDGPGVGPQRTVAYEGPETVVDLLRRAGGVGAGSAPNDVYVVRAHVDDGKQPEVFHIDLRAILEKREQTTNLRLQPFDQVYIGETNQSSLLKTIHPLLRPLYGALSGLRRATLEQRSAPDKPAAKPRDAAPTRLPDAIPPAPGTMERLSRAEGSAQRSSPLDPE